MSDSEERLRIGIPGPFGLLVHKWLGRERPPVIDALEGQWLEVSGGPLPLPLAVRVDKTPEGRFIVTGLLIGLRSRREITWETLRQIKPSTILARIFDGFDPKHPSKQLRESKVKVVEFEPGEDFDQEAWERGGLPVPTQLISPESWREDTRVHTAWRLWAGAGSDAHSMRPVEAVTRPRASVATDLTAFADTYLRHLAATPHKATTATARELHISRATAIRRIAEARAAGVLPPKGGSTS